MPGLVYWLLHADEKGAMKKAALFMLIFGVLFVPVSLSANLTPPLGNASAPVLPPSAPPPLPTLPPLPLAAP